MPNTSKLNIEIIEEENYFFRRYQEKLLKLYREQNGFLYFPATALKEIQRFCEKGLEDLVFPVL